ncbi:hypothetical protein Tco_1150231 [Tanacetum coccineum]
MRGLSIRSASLPRSVTILRGFIPDGNEKVGMKDEAKNVPHLRGQKLSRQAKINLDYRPVSPEPASGSLLAKRMLVSLSHDQTNGVKDQKEERGK